MAEDIDKSYGHWYPKKIADYRSKTARLSMLEHGAYNLMMDEYYASEGPLPADTLEIFRACHAVTKQEQETILAILHKYFHLRKDGYHNKKCDEELAKRLDIKEKRSKAAHAKHAKERASAEIVHEKTDANTPYSLQPTAYSLESTADSLQAQAAKSMEGKNGIIPTSAQIREAKSGDIGYDPKAHESSILPAAWHDYAKGKGLPHEKIFKSWDKFRETSGLPYVKKRWLAWVDRENL